MAQFCVNENIEELREALNNEVLFEKSLKCSVFCTVLEIIWNITLGKKECVKCFKKKSIKKLKSHRELIRTLLNKKKSMKRRKKLFIKSKKSFKNVIKEIVKRFLSHCIEET